MGYQQKYPCPAKPTCETVDIINLEQVGDVFSGLTGASVEASEEMNNCDGTGVLSSTVVLHNEESVSESHQYTLSKSLGSSFSTTVARSLEIKAKAGFEPLGVGGELEVTNKLEVSNTMGFSQTMGSSSTDMHSTTQTLYVQKRVHVAIQPGTRTVVSSKLDAYTFRTSFKATAYCLDKNGRRLETATLTGTFEGRSFKSGGASTNKSIPCPESDEGRRLMAPTEAHPDVMGKEYTEEAF